MFSISFINSRISYHPIQCFIQHQLLLLVFKMWSFLLMSLHIDEISAEEHIWLFCNSDTLVHRFTEETLRILVVLSVSFSNVEGIMYWIEDRIQSIYILSILALLIVQIVVAFSMFSKQLPPQECMEETEEMSDKTE